MSGQMLLVGLFTFLNILIIVSCSIRLTYFRQVAAYKGMKCRSADAIFEYEFSNPIACTLICVERENCVGVFFSNTLSLCIGCGHLNADDLEESTGDTLYFYNSAETVSWMQNQGSYYKLFTSSLPFKEAKDFCRDNVRGTLVHIDSSEEAEFVNDIAKSTLGSSSSYIIGLEYNIADSTWRWVDDNTVPTFTDWANSEPNGAQEFCVRAYGPSGYQWVDYSCGSYPFVCEKN